MTYTIIVILLPSLHGVHIRFGIWLPRTGVIGMEVFVKKHPQQAANNYGSVRTIVPVLWRRLILAALCLLLMLVCSPALAQDTQPIGSTTHYIRWLSGTDSEVTGNTMVSTPLTNRPTEHIMELGFSYTGEAAENGIEIRLPAYLFRYREAPGDRDLFPQLADGDPMINITADPNNPLNTLDIALEPWPAEPAESTYKFNYRIDPVTDELVLSNYGPFPSGSTFTTAFKFIQPRPSYVQDGYIKDDIQATFTVKPRDGSEPVTFESETLSIQYNTKADLRYVSKYASPAYFSWPFYNIDEPTDNEEGKYIYVQYRITVAVDYNDTQPYYVRLTEMIPDGEIGELYAYNTVGSARLTTLEGWTLAHDKAIQVGIPKYDYTQDPYGRSSSSYDFYVVFRYEADKLDWKDPIKPDPNNPDKEIATVKNGIKAELFGIDGD